ncbi:CIS tube protein [Adhaeribacter rhizoryzae]|uniref:LysM peptidoglycan-binding domain-containing protein n=1 Tax=Adhaeribacter rhizoryzae TaxID=2607907 RepID=A0A5M6DLN0_9BACT|nr:LysM peptidoglycan-binding domain-containing protein [Adhaeribacter rhizoryzae]KAA5548444.1 LysM peptidoglycan-binding domain-containing protein [Adhaeribacter rhizoryzae]
MADTGKLEKLKIIAYRKADMKDDSQVGQPLFALMNPETYQLDYKVEFNDGQAPGTSGAQQKYKMTKPEEFTFDILFDSTGIIDGKPKADIWDDLKAFKQMLVDYDGAIHQPRFFKLIWGVTLFKGRLASLSITFKLFKPDGTPIRAIAKAQFKGSVEENLRVAKEKSQSPDLTHLRQVKAGDNLPFMCFKIYEDPRYYLQVAQANNLTNFRRLAVGSFLHFPPFAQQDSNNTS